MNKNKSSVMDNISATLSKFSLSIDSIVAAFFSSFVLAYIFQMFDNSKFFELQEYYSSINFTVFFLVTIVGGLTLCGLTYIFKMRSLIPRALVTLCTILSIQYACAYDTKDVYFILGIGLVDFIAVLWAVKDDKLELSKINISYKTCFIAAIVLCVVTSIYFSYITSLKYQNFLNATFDFGIFAQMFENMATTGAPITTVERSVEMSHFGVHF